MTEARPVRLTVNGAEHAFDLPRDTKLIYVLRSCVVTLKTAEDRSVTTLEGLGHCDALHPVQAAFIDAQAAQCGYCLNGMIMSATALLARNPTPSVGEIREALRYNLCRCGTHVEIVQAVMIAAGAHPKAAGTTPQ